MKRCLITLCALTALTSTAVGEVPVDDLVGNEFPGLQLLPPGSKVRGISLPRYENHRVSALLMTELLVAIYGLIYMMRCTKELSV